MVHKYYRENTKFFIKKYRPIGQRAVKLAEVFLVQIYIKKIYSAFFLVTDELSRSLPNEDCKDCKAIPNEDCKP